jgi:hypothetical protein
VKIADRLARIDWSEVGEQLRERGHAVVKGVMPPARCRGIAAMYGDDRRFRSTVSMERHAFGAGEYRYFGYPLPADVQELRTGLYRRLAPIANEWMTRLRRETRYPRSLRAFLARCHDHGQSRPTCLLLRYGEGGYNRLHRDLYGEVAFPLQAALFLSRPGEDHGGGEFLLLEHRPRAQSRGEAIVGRQGSLIVFPNAERPTRGKRGDVRVDLRHGVSRVHWGERCTLGIIFHDAR